MNEMKTKRVELWCDLWPGWQDHDPPDLFLVSHPPAQKPAVAVRVKVVAMLPCFGGSMEQDASVLSDVTIVEG